MIKITSDCVGCVKECIYDACPKYSVEVHNCDNCGKPAKYVIDNDELCYDCLEREMDDYWSCLSVWEKARLLDVEIGVLS